MRNNIDAIREVLAAANKRIYAAHAPNGHAYSSGWFESTLADALDMLEQYDPAAVARILTRAERVCNTPEI